ncbi:acyl carrier protein [Gordonia sp. zg691]|uniref:Acyl carrier protein n=1 Tax=Gordonia jinghuaiqii TaxID=2758710 RepID=A0A7D7R2W5_9ACTN|nr:acyl carrier protein [Gordonia jinghuaiqii]MBD0863094.1 acyl carrier protein [Gordonia jinghuaiqii]MCR5980394.1 acyl carrier protein [Gordonia jinghuaiqii]QMT01867.1 acyl carrier protein [Gordonia jinghuaiqii]
MSADHIVKIFCRVLDETDVEPSSDFFELGGDSLLATRVLSAIARDFGVELTWEDFIEKPTPEGLFELVPEVER